MFSNYTNLTNSKRREKKIEKTFTKITTTTKISEIASTNGNDRIYQQHNSNTNFRLITVYGAKLIHITPSHNNAPEDREQLTETAI